MAPKKKKPADVDVDTDETASADATSVVETISAAVDEAVPETTADVISSRIKPGYDSRSQLGALLSSDIIAATMKTYGKKTLIQGSEIKARKVRRIPTGIFPIDFALEGGWAQGGVHTLIGHKSSCKTTALYSTFGEAQKMCAECWMYMDRCICKRPREPVIAYIDVEGALDAAWASRFCDLDKVLISVPEYAEQTLSIGEALLRSGKCDILAIDSIAFLTPAKEIEEAIEKDLMGQQARVLGKGVRKFTAALNSVMTDTGKRPTLFFTNQIRMKIGVMFGNPETTPGGLAPGFMSWTEMKMKTGKFKMDELGERPLYADFGFSLDKSKSSTAKVGYDFRMMLSDSESKSLGDFYYEDFILDHAERLGLVSGGGTSWKILGESFGKKSEIEKRLVADPIFKRMVTDVLLKSVQQGA
jgi:recombination protein RecA